MNNKIDVGFLIFNLERIEYRKISHSYSSLIACNSLNVIPQITQETDGCLGTVVRSDSILLARNVHNEFFHFSVKLEMVLSPRFGRTTSKEEYAFIYRLELIMR